VKPRPLSSIPLPRTASAAAALAAMLIGSVLALTGCGGSTPTASSPAGSATSGTAAATTTGAAGASAVSGKEFCAALEAEQPKLDKERGPDGAFITLSLALVDLYDSKNAVESMDASTMDALAASCPAVAAKALKSTGKSSFAEFR
jgi:hypothetical protein